MKTNEKPATAMQMNDASLRQRWQNAWSGMSVREQRLVGLAGLLLALALLLGLGVWPAWQTLRQAQAQQPRLSQQLHAMQQLQARANLLKALPQPAAPGVAGAPPATPASNEQALRQSLQPLGDTARLQLSEQRAQITLQGADTAALTAWWAQARSQAQANTLEAKLVRRQVGEQVVWDGQLVMGLAPP